MPPPQKKLSVSTKDPLSHMNLEFMKPCGVDTPTPFQNAAFSPVYLAKVATIFKTIVPKIWNLQVTSTLIPYVYTSLWFLSFSITPF